MKVITHSRVLEHCQLGDLHPGETFIRSESLDLTVHILLKPHRGVKLDRGYLLTAALETGFTYPMHRDTKVNVFHVHAVESAA